MSHIILAAMSSSKGDIVTQLVSLFVCHEGVFQSLNRICSDIGSDWMFQGCLRLFYSCVLKKQISKGKSIGHTVFFAAMSSSRSDVVTQCVHMCVPVFVPFFFF